MHERVKLLFWIMFGFVCGVMFLSATMSNYERPPKWEDGAIITHEGKAYKLQAIEPPAPNKSPM